MFLKPATYFGERGSATAEDFKRRMLVERNVELSDDDIFGEDNGSGRSLIVFLNYFVIESATLGTEFDDGELTKSRDSCFEQFLAPLGAGSESVVDNSDGDSVDGKPRARPVDATRGQGEESVVDNPDSDSVDGKPKARPVDATHGQGEETEGGVTQAGGNVSTVPSRSVEDFRVKPYYKFKLVPAMTPRENTYLKHCEESSSDYNLRHLVVNKDDHKPFSQNIDLSTSNQIMGGKSVFNIHDMRKKLQDKGFFDQMVADSDDEDIGNDPATQDSAPQTTDLPPLPVEVIGNETGSTSKSLSKTCYETIGIVFCNIHSGMLRLMGASLVERVDPNGERLGFSATTLAAPYLPSIFRIYPSPMACRSLDIVPLSTILNALAVGLIRKSNSNRIWIERHDYVATKKHLWERGSLQTEEEKLLLRRIQSVMRNVPLLRVTGNIGFALQFSDQFERETQAGSEFPADFVERLPFGLPVVKGSGKEIWHLFETFLRSASKRHKGTGTLRLEEVFAKQHYHKIPKVVRSSTENLIRYCVNGVYQFDDDFNGITSSIYKLSCKHPAPKDVDGYVKWCYDNQERLRDGLLKLAVEKWDGTGVTKPNDWEFLVQAKTLDIEGAFVFPLMEPHSVRLEKKMEMIFPTLMDRKELIQTG